MCIYACASVSIYICVCIYAVILSCKTPQQCLASTGLEACLSSGSLVPHLQFEVTGSSQNTSSGAPARARHNARNMVRGVTCYDLSDVRSTLDYVIGTMSDIISTFSNISSNVFKYQSFLMVSVSSENGPILSTVIFFCLLTV